MKSRILHYHLLLFTVLVICALPLTVHAASKKASAKADEVIAAVITDGMSEKNKALALHDWLINNACYDSTHTRFTADGVLLHKTGVCQSYAEAYQLLLEKVGIDCRILTGYARDEDDELITHAWNLVRIKGKWYHVDVTWDDPVDRMNPKSTEVVSGYENNLYFMASTAFILTNHIPDDESEALLKELVGEKAMSELPAAVKMKKSVPAPAFTFKNSSGKTLTLKNFGTGKNMMLIYGTTICGNTSAYLSDIKSYVKMMKEAGITVVFFVLDADKTSVLKKLEKQYPGVVCTMYSGSGDDGMFTGLERFKAKVDTVFPIIYLKNADDRLVYYSVNYVSDPLKIVAGALKMAGQKTETIGAGKYTLYKNSKTAVFTAPKNKNAATLSIPASVKAGKVTYKVTGISSSACKGMTKLKKVTIGKNVSSIGKNAFNGCGSLKAVAVKTVKLKKASVGSGAFGKINAKAAFTVPKSCKDIYRQVFLSRGAPKGCSFK